MINLIVYKAARPALTAIAEIDLGLISQHLILD